MNNLISHNSQIIIYRNKNGEVKLDVHFDGDTVWLSQKQMAELFDCTVENVIFHLKNVFESGELNEEATTKESLVVQQEGKRAVQRQVRLYNLDGIISIGYKVNSIRGTQFRIWATQKLKEYIIKGFVLDDERLKNPDLPFDYFGELTNYEYFTSDSELSISAIKHATRISHSTIKQALSRLVEYKLVERLGQGRATRYKKTT